MTQEDMEIPPNTAGETALAEKDERTGLMRWDEALTLEGQVEAVLFAAPKPLSMSELAEILQDEEGKPEVELIESTVQRLLRLYLERNGGFRLEHEKGAGYQFRSVPAAAPLMERMFASRQRPLSRAALETLAIIAYRQPATRADIEYIRGVDAGSIIKNLLDRELIICVGRKEDAGRPMMFGTSTEFLRVFRLNSLSDLPPLAAFQPSPELMVEAMNRLDEPREEVDVEAFLEDPEQMSPSISAGLGSAEFADDFADAKANFEVIDPEHKPRDRGQNGINRAGASKDAEGSDGHGSGEHD